MARKKIEPIKSLGNENKLIVQKSLPLFSLWQSELTLAEFKILDTYLSRIDSRKPDKRVVVFEKVELERLLGIKKINISDLETRLKHLMGSVVKIIDDNEKKGFRLVTLFEEAIAEQDDYGLWQIKLEATQKAMKYFFNIDNLGYLRYKLRCITSLTSRYTYIMFIYIESNRFRKCWEVNIDDIKKILDCEKEECYKQFKVFNDRLLKRVQKEMNEKTECRYTYEPVKKGRTVTRIRFKVETLKDIVIDEKQVDEDKQKAEEKQLELWQTPLESFNFSDEEYAELQSILITIPKINLPNSENCYDDIELMRYHYIDQKSKDIIKRKNIKNKFAYLKKILKEDMK